MKKHFWRILFYIPMMLIFITGVTVQWFFEWEYDQVFEWKPLDKFIGYVREKCEHDQG